MTRLPLEDLRRVTTADVYKGSTLAAHLRRDDRGTVTFAYRDSYAGPAVASTLPIGSNPVTTPSGSLPPFFSGMLPEGHRLTVLRTAAKTSADDELTLLLAVGAEAPGDVRILPTGIAPYDETPLATTDPSTLDFAALAGIPDRTALAGVQVKISASMVNVPLTLRGHSALLKLDPRDHPHLVANEALHLTHAPALGLPVAQHTVVHDRNGLSGLLVGRFDRILDDTGTIHRVAMEDAAQVLGIHPAQKYNVTTEEVILALTGLTSARPVAARNLYLQFLFAWLTGNGDLHAKNVAVLQAPTGSWQISPIFDIPCTAVYRDMTMALSIDGRVKKIRRRHWDALAHTIGLPPRAADAAIHTALAAANRIDLTELPFEGSPLNGAQRELGFRRSLLTM